MNMNHSMKMAILAAQCKNKPDKVIEQYDDISVKSKEDSSDQSSVSHS